MIAYCITVYNELEEISRLLSILESVKEPNDEIVIIHTYRDEFEKLSNNYEQIQAICRQHSSDYYNFHFQNNFANLKNYMTSKVSSDQKYIFNFDADETMKPEMLKELRNLLTTEDIDLLYLPRINIVDGLTEEDIQKWKWTIDENGWINWPDYQPRIYKNNGSIKWTSKVHERLEGFKNYGIIEPDSKIAIMHKKHIDKQRMQNALYDQINISRD
jgi:glycosyltransferase involved in cell wall biosynthesis